MCMIVLRLKKWSQDPGGKLLADKGYNFKEALGTVMAKRLASDHWNTARNIKNYLMPPWDKVLLRKRFIIETLFDKLKSQMGLEHTRHRSPINAFVDILSCLAAYMLGKTKVKMKKIAYP